MNETITAVVKKHLAQLKESHQRSLDAALSHQMVANSLAKQILDCEDFLEAAKNAS